MNNPAIIATLKGAINALERRETPLAPLEKMKLKTLRLNLEAALASAASVQNRHDAHASLQAPATERSVHRRSP